MKHPAPSPRPLARSIATAFLICPISLFLYLLISPSAASAEEVFKEIKPVLSVPFPGLSLSSVFEEKGYLYVNYLAEFITAAYSYLVGIAGILAISMIMYGGMKWIFAGGDAGKIKMARERIVHAVIGLVLALGSYLILFTINPDLVKFRALRLLVIPAEFISTESTDRDIEPEDLAAPRQGTNNVPLFKQWDYTQAYGSCGTIKSSGCGPTSMAMVMKFHGAGVDPVVVANSFAADGKRVCGNGTAYSAFTESKLLNQFNLRGESVGRLPSKIIELLKAKQPIIVSVGSEAKGFYTNGTQAAFTKGGHFIVLTGIDKDGNITINDPNKALVRAKPDQILPFLKGAWYVHPK